MTPHINHPHIDPENLHSDVVRPQALIQTTSAVPPVSTDVLDLGTIIMFQGFWWSMLLTAVGVVVCTLLGVALCIYRGRLRVKDKAKPSFVIALPKPQGESTQVDTQDGKSDASHETLKYPPQVAQVELRPR